MKKSIITLALVLVIAMLTGCAGTPVVYYSDCTCPTGAHTEATTPVETTNPVESVPVEGALKTGVAILASAAESKSATAEENGEAKYDVSVVAVTVDEAGVIQGCVIDSIGTSVTFDAAGAVTSDLTAAIATKNELGEAYGMKDYAGAKYEWNEQAAALASFAVGKTVEELRAGAVDETGHAVDADLATTATIYLGAQAGDELKLAIAASVDGSKNADAENAGLSELYITATAVTVNEGVITSCQIDAVQGKVNFDATGTITGGTEGYFASKNMLGEQYGMVAWGGAIAEWDQQAASFAAYITGKTADEVAGIAVDESTKTTDADLLTSVTIKIGEFQNLIAKACG